MPRESPSTYVVQKRSDLQEIERLSVQDKMMMIEMGGALPELTDPTQLRCVLDVGCGTGGWLLETARTYPMIERLVGVDISQQMVTHARGRAEELGLGERVEFQTMDALQGLGFPNASFDLVNQRLGLSWLRTWEWKKILTEYRRLIKPSGIMRITESTLVVESNSSALMQLNAIMLEAFYRSSHFFTESSEGITRELEELMAQHGVEEVQSRVCTQVYTHGIEVSQYFYEDMRHLFRVGLPFFQKWARVPGNYQQIYRKAMKEMRGADFMATGYLLTAWGTRRVE